MNVNCPKCNTPVTADGVNITEMIAICKSCHNIFRFEHESSESEEPTATLMPEQEPTPDSTSTPSRLKQEIYHIPPGFEILEHENRLEILIKWRKVYGYLFILIFTILWNIPFLTNIIIVLISGDPGEMGWNKFALIVFVVLCADTIFVYWSLRQLLNITYITVNRRQISIEHKPFRFPLKNKYYDRAEVEQLYVKEEIIKNKNGKYEVYDVELFLKNGKKHTLIEDLHEPEMARLIEQEIEKYMNIEDKAVSDEWKGE